MVKRENITEKLSMFNMEKQIRQYAREVHGEFEGDFLLSVVSLMDEWESEKYDGMVKFKNDYEILVASLLLYDDLLPAAARRAFARIPIDCSNEHRAAKTGSAALKISAVKGRPTSSKRLERIARTYELLSLDENAVKTTIHAQVAKEFHVLMDTVERDYSRMEQAIKGLSKLNGVTSENLLKNVGEWLGGICREKIPHGHEHEVTKKDVLGFIEIAWSETGEKEG